MNGQRGEVGPTIAEQLVGAYLEDVRRALRGLPAEEADEIMLSVREHIDAALDELGHPPTTGDVERVLRELGTVEQIAPDGAGDHPPPAVFAQQSEKDRSREIIGWVLIGLAVLALLLVLLPVVAIPLALASLIGAATGLRGRAGPMRRQRHVAIALSAVALALSTALMVLLFPVTTDVSPQPIEPSPLPADEVP